MMEEPHDSPSQEAGLSSDGLTLNGDAGVAEYTRPKYFQSRRVRKEDIEKPWLLEPIDPKEKWVTIMPLIGAVLGTIISIVLVWDGWRQVINHKYCLVYEDDFSQGLDLDVWQTEIQAGGYGTGSFEMTTADEENIFVDEFGLNLMPTLQDEAKMDTDGATINLGNECTAKNRFYCSAHTDTSNGTVVPPVKSARINTSKSKYITYGRVEVVARMPAGDWLWPAIWMMPMGDDYGPWPASGEIDIVETRGNNHTYPQGGNNIASSALHWGPDTNSDAWYRTYKKRSASHTTYSAHFHRFTLEWSQKYLFTYINSRLMQVLYTPFEKPLWQVENFASKVDANNSAFQDPWKNGPVNAPFDKPFYLILNVAVGATNEWFKDGVAGKPWTDDSPTAPKEFWEARDKWFPTWTQPAMQVKRVVMWQQCDGDEQDWGVTTDEATAVEDETK